MIGSIGVEWWSTGWHGRRVVCSAPGGELGGLITLHAHSLSLYPLDRAVHFPPSVLMSSLFFFLFSLCLLRGCGYGGGSTPLSSLSHWIARWMATTGSSANALPAMTGARSRPSGASRKPRPRSSSSQWKGAAARQQTLPSSSTPLRKLAGRDSLGSAHLPRRRPCRFVSFSGTHLFILHSHASFPAKTTQQTTKASVVHRSVASSVHQHREKALHIQMKLPVSPLSHSLSHYIVFVSLSAI